ncbi:B-cell receptor CD22 isoform X1 [Meriones unguiculatus]|uniref:B-cell receptor CD22 isoform X1 n=1 Tax=Meriones unguiculatus TaxID=10047 RepID=UPI00293E11C9|nr:B-cell receptor CD22 isoform X1 [Meriones unguiculatus]
MRLHCPRLLLILALWPIRHVALHDSAQWTVAHPETLFAWEGACIRIPCKYIIQNTNTRGSLDRILVLQHFDYDDSTKDFKGTTLFQYSKSTPSPSKMGRVTFLGDLQSNCTLKIHPVRANDSGKLGLRMLSGDHKWMEPIQLNVSETPFQPSIQLPPEIQESQRITLTCGLNFACFEYDIHFWWSLEKPGVTSVTSITSSVEKVYTESKLTFEAKWSDHGKTVKCEVWHSAWLLSERTVSLDVKHTPKLNIRVSPTEVKEGEPVTMACEVNSSNPAAGAVSWFKDGQPLEEQRWRPPTLTLRAARNMSGRYQCRASNAVGQGASAEVALTVLFPPEPSQVRIYHSPADEGQSIELICASPASPPATNYTWLHNRKEVPGETGEKFHIARVSLRHAGSYTCLAENPLGRGQIGEEAELDVQYAPKAVTMVIQSSTPIREGDSVTLACHYNSSNPEVTSYQWKPQGSGNELTPGVLQIRRVAWDTGPISCAACNHWCSWTSWVSLNVHYAPRAVKVLKVSPMTEIRAGQHVLLRCDFSKSHPAEVGFFWKKNGSLVQKGKDLSFQSISPEDAGDYVCTVRNAIGETPSQAWDLQVLYAPRRLRVSISPGDSVMEGKEATLSCESDANPPVSQYIWYDPNGQDLHFSGQKLRLDLLRVQHSGSYRCRGANQIGWNESLPSVLSVYYSPETIGKRAAMGLGVCLAVCILAFWGMKIWKKWKRHQSQQQLQENSSGQSFFVRNKKTRRTPLSEGPQPQGCYNPAMDETVSYAILRFPETDTPSAGDAGPSAAQGPPPDDTVTYSVIQKHQPSDYENVTPSCPEDESIHYSELVRFGAGTRAQVKEDVEYVTLKH